MALFKSILPFNIAGLRESMFGFLEDQSPVPYEIASCKILMTGLVRPGPVVP
jgi:hypothetical protein